MLLGSDTLRKVQEQEQNMPIQPCGYGQRIEWLLETIGPATFD
jgi:hypothetical protein